MCVIALAPPTPYLGDVSDERLVALFRSGSSDAFGELDRRHRRLVCGHLGRMLGRREDVEDLAQDVMLRAAAELRRRDEPIEHVRAWLLRVAHNRGIDILRSARATAELPDGLLAPDDPVAQSLTRLELDDTLGALRALPDAQRRALVLNAVHGVPYEDVAASLHVTPKAARALAFRGRAAVRQRMSEEVSTDAGHRRRTTVSSR